MMIHILQASGRLEGHNAARIAGDYRIALHRNADVIGFTELWPAAKARLSEECRAAGYHLYAPADVGIAIRHADQIEGQATVPVSGGRDLTWIRFRLPGESLPCTFFETHWHTMKVHTQGFLSQTDDLITHMRSAAKHGPVFYGGDTNRGMQGHNPIRDRLDKAGMPTIFESLNDWHPTHAHIGTIDVIGTDMHTGHARPHSLKVWPQTYSDHRQVSAWYELTGPQTSHGIAPHHAQHTGDALTGDGNGPAAIQSQIDALRQKETQVRQDNQKQDTRLQKISRRIRGKR